MKQQEIVKCDSMFYIFHVPGSIANGIFEFYDFEYQLEELYYYLPIRLISQCLAVPIVHLLFSINRSAPILSLFFWASAPWRPLYLNLDSALLL